MDAARRIHPRPNPRASPELRTGQGRGGAGTGAAGPGGTALDALTSAPN